MELIAYYIIFCLATSITCCLMFYWPVIVEARQLNIDNEFTRYPVLSTVIYLVITTIVAPLLFLPLVSETKAELFKKGLRKSIIEQE